jgi:hypothetical protein
MAEKKSILNVEMARAMKYTGVRYEEYQDVKAAKRYTDPDTYNTLIRNLNRREKSAISQRAKAEAKREVKAAAERERINRMIREAEEEKKKNKPIIDIKANRFVTNENLFGRSLRDVFQDDFMTPITEAREKHNVKRGDTLYVQVSQDKEIVDSQIVNITYDNYESIFWGNLARPFIIWNITSDQGNLVQFKYQTD